MHITVMKNITFFANKTSGIIGVTGGNFHYMNWYRRASSVGLLFALADISMGMIFMLNLY